MWTSADEYLEREKQENEKRELNELNKEELIRKIEDLESSNKMLIKRKNHYYEMLEEVDKMLFKEDKFTISSYISKNKYKI